MPEYVERNMILAKSAPIPGCFCNMISAWDVKNLPAADVAPIVYGKWKNGNSIGPNISIKTRKFIHTAIRAN